MSVPMPEMGWIKNTAFVIAIYYPCLTYGAARSTVWRERDRFETDKEQKSWAAGFGPARAERGTFFLKKLKRKWAAGLEPAPKYELFKNNGSLAQ